MRQGSANSGLPAGNPLANVLVIIVGALAIGASIVLGFFAFVVLGSIVLIMAAIIGIRLWWFNRMMRQASQKNPDSDAESGAARPRTAGGVIEGEFVIIDKDDDKP